MYGLPIKSDSFLSFTKNAFQYFSTFTHQRLIVFEKSLFVLLYAEKPAFVAFYNVECQKVAKHTLSLSPHVIIEDWFVISIG